MHSQAHSVLTHRPALGVGVAAWRRTDAPDRPMAAGPTGMLVHAPTVGVDGGRGSRSFNHGCADPKPGVDLVLLTGCPKVLAYAVERRRAPCETRVIGAQGTSRRGFGQGDESVPLVPGAPGPHAFAAL